MSEPECPQKKPYVIDEEPGTKAWCSCGKSQNQPYCDGAHAGTEFRPEIVQITEKGPVAWCGCKKSAQGARCDGSHSSL